MTTQLSNTLQRALDAGDLNVLADLMRKIRLGTMLSPIKLVATGLTAAASFDITAVAFRAFCTLTGVEIPTGEGLPAILAVKTLRITASGTAGSVGPYVVGDAGVTPAIPPTATAYAGAAVGLAKLSDDGKTITFPNTVTAFTLEYIARAYTDLDDTFASPTP